MNDLGIVTVGVLVFNDEKNKVVLVRHGDRASHLTGTYGVPGGRKDEGETELQAAMRELREETGLEVLEEDLIEYPHNFYTADIPRKDGTTKRFTGHIFIAKRFYGGLKALEETIPEWIDISRLDTYNLLPNVAKMVQDGVKYI